MTRALTQWPVADLPTRADPAWPIAEPPTRAIPVRPVGESPTRAVQGGPAEPTTTAEPAGPLHESAPQAEPVWPGEAALDEAAVRSPDARTRITVTPVGGSVRDSQDGCVHCEYRDVDEDGYCLRCGLRQPTGRDRMADDVGVVAGVSDRGRVRESNADAMAFGFTGDAAQPEYVAAVVCDGVGSGAMAGQAAQNAADAGAAELLGCLADGLDARKASTMAIAAAGDAVNALAEPGPAEEDTPATTYVSAVVTGAEVTVAWLGDSRAYWVAPGARADAAGAHGGPGEGVTCLTTDHTVRNTYLADGMRAAHTLTRWLGADSDGTDPQVSTVRPDRAGVLVLCTDGLWGYLDDPGTLAARVLTHGSAAGAAAGLVGYALSEGGRDNVAVIAVPFPAGRRWP
ncbi:PP2C family protein-serine/threonine phosphatase [Haloechinothrix alba]|nr:protein phosphatase 2C domain-containing protein [Haloechinothrix alba]